jgi:hypothetical protein
LNHIDSGNVTFLSKNVYRDVNRMHVVSNVEKATVGRTMYGGNNKAMLQYPAIYLANQWRQWGKYTKLMDMTFRLMIIVMGILPNDWLEQTSNERAEMKRAQHFKDIVASKAPSQFMEMAINKQAGLTWEMWWDRWIQIRRGAELLLGKVENATQSPQRPERENEAE